MDRLSPVDASFLAGERTASHMHVGGIMIFEGPPPSHEAALEHIASRLHMVPRYRQKLAVPRFEMGRPMWVDDPSFNLEYHVRQTALATPGGVHELKQLAARIFSQRLDRSKPLWESWFVQGLEGDRFAVINKTHHALVDGIAGVDLATVLFDLTPEPADRGEVPEWAPQDEPTDAQLVAEGVKGLLRTPVDIARRVAGAVQNPGELRDSLEGLSEVAWANLNPAPETPLNVPIGPHRRITWLQTDLADFKTIKNALGGTVNDVVLAVVAGAIGTWLRRRGVRTEGLELRAQVPVSIRSDDDRHRLGNRIAVMRAPLPVYARDPVERLNIVRGAMAGLKQSKQALAAEVIAGLEDFAPPTILSMASRMNWSTRLFNLIVTNVPGPQIPLYMQGRKLLEVVPVAFLPENYALTVAVMSYHGKLDFSLLGDYDAMADIELLREYVHDALEELLLVARPASPRSGRERTERGPSRPPSQPAAPDPQRP
jgi:WS/DGAT/MGAT family acyltransferase